MRELPSASERGTVLSEIEGSDQAQANEIYKQASEDHRFYGDMRFKQLTLFGVLSGLLLNALNSQTLHPLRWIFGLVGIASTTLLWIMEVRSSVHAQKALEIKRFYEKQRTVHPPTRFELRWTLINATNAILMFYLASFVSWTVVFLAGIHRSLFYGIVLLLVLLLLVVFTIREYEPLLKHAWKYWHW